MGRCQSFYSSLLQADEARIFGRGFHKLRLEGVSVAMMSIYQPSLCTGEYAGIYSFSLTSNFLYGRYQWLVLSYKGGSSWHVYASWNTCCYHWSDVGVVVQSSMVGR